MTDTPSDAANEPTSLRELMRRGDYVKFWTARVASTLGVQIQSVALGWQMYAVARDSMGVKEAAFYVGMIGLAAFVAVSVRWWALHRFGGGLLKTAVGVAGLAATWQLRMGKVLPEARQV